MTAAVTFDAGCDELARLLARDEDVADEAALARIASHIDTCHVCASAERRLSGVLGRFRSCEVRDLDDAFERAIVDQICAGR
jgi:hypothetical protein